MSSRGSSINILKVKPNDKGVEYGINIGYLRHNTREKATPNSIFRVNEETVKYRHEADEAFSLALNILADREWKYQQRTGQKVQKSVIKHFSAVVNLEPHHTMEDVHEVVKYIQDTLDTAVVQIAIHRDEGHTVQNPHTHEKIPMINDHAHIEFIGLDSQGNSIRRKMSRAFLQQLQTNVARILGMRRGKPNSTKTKEEKKATKRLGTYEYKKHKARESKTIQDQRLTMRLLKEENRKLRAELQANKALRVDYAQVEQMVNETKDILELESLKKQLAI